MPEERRHDNIDSTWLEWLWHNIAPFLPLTLTLLAIFDSTRAVQYAAAAAAIAGFTGSHKPPTILNGGITKPPL